MHCSSVRNVHNKMHINELEVLYRQYLDLFFCSVLEEPSWTPSHATGVGLNDLFQSLQLCDSVI